MIESKILARPAAGLYCFVLMHLTACNTETTCQSVDERILASDETAAEGLRPLDIIQLASQAEASMTWIESRSNAETDAESTVSVRVERTSEPSRYEETKQVGSEESDLGCGSFITVPVSMNISTSDGALEEALDTELVANVLLPNQALIEIEFDFESIAGTLEPSLESARGELRIEFRENGGFSGVVGARRESTQGGSAMVEWSPLGYWGSFLDPDDEV